MAAGRRAVELRQRRAPLVVEAVHQLRVAPERLGTAFADADWYGVRVILPASLLLVVTGFGVAGTRELAVSEPWIAVPLAIWIVSAVLTLGVLGPLASRLKRDAPPALVGRYLLLARVELLLLLVAVVVMVTKPGA